jgi:serine/threonine-protein kinase
VEPQLGRYQVLSKLAQGGMAEVFVAKLVGASGFTKRYAIKRLLPELSADPELVQMLLDEARIASSLSHPNICQIFELGESDGRHFIAMEYLEGQTLAQLMRTARAERQPLPFEVSAHIVARAAEGLAYAHERRGDDGAPMGIVHRDVSPDNVMLTRDGQVKLLDFGIARATHRSRRTRTGLIRGKVAYMAPEHIRGEALDGRADVFALGVVLWELLAGRDLFRSQDDVQAMYAVLNGAAPARPPDARAPAPLWEIAERALERDPARRTPSARQLAADLDAALSRLGARVDPSRLVALAQAPAPELPAAPEQPRHPAAATPLGPRPAEPVTQREVEAERKRTRAVDAEPVRRSGRVTVIAVAAVVVVVGALAAAARWLPHEAAPPAPEVAVVPATPVSPQPVVVPEPPAAPAVEPEAPPAHEPAPPAAEPEAPPAHAPARPAPAAHTKRGPARSAHARAPIAPAAAAEPAVGGSGRLALDTHPWTHVYLDGRLLGDTPLNEVVVPAGHLKLRAVNPELKLDKTIEVDVAPDQTARVRREW